MGKMTTNRACSYCGELFQAWGQERQCSLRCKGAGRPLRKSPRQRRAERLAANGGSHTEEQWQALVKRYGCCVCCGDMLAKLYRDHVVPVAWGGNDDISNIQPLCKPCNFRKAAHRSTDYRAKPLFPADLLPGVASRARETG
jgi:5-methylcytosine-specific restriction endonuclease McrA